MSMADFKARWDAHIQRTGWPDYGFVRANLGDYPISAEDRNWLVGIGLPKDASFFSFDEFPEDGLKPVLSIYGRPGDWTDADRERTARYLYLGCDGGGNPVCIDSQDGNIVMLNHENEFWPYDMVNSSVRQFAESLLAYAEIIEDFQSEYGDVDPYEDGLPADMHAAAEARLREIDPGAFGERSFWRGVLDDIRRA